MRDRTNPSQNILFFAHLFSLHCCCLFAVFHRPGDLVRITFDDFLDQTHALHGESFEQEHPPGVREEEVGSELEDMLDETVVRHWKGLLALKKLGRGGGRGRIKDQY